MEETLLKCYLEQDPNLVLVLYFLHVLLNLLRIFLLFL